ncbi:unnamed protein product [Merluccius merluccius]
MCASMHVVATPCLRKQPSAGELALGAFISGLTSERLREHLCIKAPTSLSAALEEAERVEAVMTPCKRPGP